MAHSLLADEEYLLSRTGFEDSGGADKQFSDADDQIACLGLFG